MQDQQESRFRRAAFVTAIRLQKKAPSPAFSTRESRGMKSPESSTRPVQILPDGRRVNESAAAGIAINGKMIIVGAADPLEVSPLLLISGRRSVTGWPSGSSVDSQDAMRFSAQAGVRSMNEIFRSNAQPGRTSA